jgi:hypothetical protein
MIASDMLLLLLDWSFDWSQLITLADQAITSFYSHRLGSQVGHLLLVLRAFPPVPGPALLFLKVSALLVTTATVALVMENCRQQRVLH